MHVLGSNRSGVRRAVLRSVDTDRSIPINTPALRFTTVAGGERGIGVNHTPGYARRYVSIGAYIYLSLEYIWRGPEESMK